MIGQLVSPLADGIGLERLRQAQAIARHDRSQGWAALNQLFRTGALPAPSPNGRFRGELVALRVAPGLTMLANAIARAWMPWQGKSFIAVAGAGENIFSRDSYLPAHVIWPLYRGYDDDGPVAYRAFEFHTHPGPGLFDPDRQVLKINYDLAVNPRLTVRRVLDELVQLGPGLYLGKAHLRWWWGRWQTVAFFALHQPGRD